MSSLEEKEDINTNAEIEVADNICNNKKLKEAYQLQKEGFPAAVVAELTGLTEGEVTKPEVRR